jgi:hypothetical protein
MVQVFGMETNLIEVRNMGISSLLDGKV